MEALEVDLRAVISSANEIIETLGIEKHLDVRFELPDHPVRVRGDAGQLERVVLNLVSNAIKFTEDEGAVTCRLSLTANDVFMSVTDTGIGIPTVEQAHLFDKFYRGAGARDRAIQGTGLGLHIAASIVSNHGGDVSVDSVVGLGTTFTVRLPALG
jgi:signal transduction histidine kinase